MDERTFAHLRNSLGLLPKPIKISRGQGVQGYYPKETVAHLVRIEALHRQGKSYPQIAVILQQETQRLIEKCEELRKNYEFERGIRRRLASSLTAGSQPDFYFKDSKREKAVSQARLDALKSRLKNSFRKWDGGSLSQLKQIRGLIDKVQELETTKRLVRQARVSSGVVR